MPARLRPRLPAAAAALALALLAAAAPPGAAQDAPPTTPPVQTPAPRARPNVVLIVADDLGWGETSMQGGDVPTPSIDAIAKAGVRFTNGYVTCPVCAPTRAGLLSGRYGQRFGFEHNPGPASAAPDRFGLPRDVPTLAERLKALGYATGMVGKWHLGYREGVRPTERGFDAFFGFLGGAHPYLRGRRAAAILRGATPVEEPAYLTDAFAREATAFVEANASRPFFLYLPFNAVHAPMQADDARLARAAATADPRRRAFAAMLTAMDEAVGAVLGALRRAGALEDTLVVFLSDNGGPTPSTTSRNGPLRGTKGTVYEGGVRVPFAMAWPRRLPAGAVYAPPVVSLDVVPTVLAAAGAPAGPDAALDGVDLAPFVRGEAAGRPHVALWWRFGRQTAVRVGDWKLVRRADEAPELYDLAHDVGEGRDLAAEHPDRVVQLDAAYAVWDLRNAPAAWGGEGGRRARTGRGAAGRAPRDAAARGD